MPSFGLAFCGKINIPPARETIFKIPLALAMTKKHDCRHINILKTMGLYLRRNAQMIKPQLL